MVHAWPKAESQLKLGTGHSVAFSVFNFKTDDRLERKTRDKRRKPIGMVLANKLRDAITEKTQ